MVTESPVATHRQGRTLIFQGAWIAGAATVAGPAEGRGPLGSAFDRVVDDHLMGQKSWERAESELICLAVDMLLQRLGLQREDFDVMLGGDLADQLTASTFAAREIDIPFLGLFTACGTFAQGLGLAAALCDGGYVGRVLLTVSSHHDAAERQYRFPTEFGNQRPPTAQWTATGAVAVAIVAEPRDDSHLRIEAFTPGRVIDFCQKNPLDMGSAMAPAAADTIAAHLSDLQRQPGDYAAIYSGDLGRVGKPICEDLLSQRGITAQLHDCGVELYDPGHQDIHAGGSGPACSALVFCARILPELKQGHRACLAGTGALHSPTTYQQGESIPAIAHAVTVTSAERG